MQLCFLYSDINCLLSPKLIQLLPSFLRSQVKIPRFSSFRKPYICIRVYSNKTKHKLLVKSSKNIRKKEGGSDRSVSENQSSSVALNKLAIKARKPYCNFELQQ